MGCELCVMRGSGQVVGKTLGPLRVLCKMDVIQALDPSSLVLLQTVTLQFLSVAYHVVDEVVDPADTLVQHLPIPRAYLQLPTLPLRYLLS